MKVSAYVHNFAGSYVAIAVVAGVKVTATGTSESEVLGALAFKILDSTEPKFVELDLAAYARAYPSRNDPPAKLPPAEPAEHPLETAKRIAEMRASGLSIWQIATKLDVAQSYVANQLATLEKLAPAVLTAIAATIASDPKEASR